MRHTVIVAIDVVVAKLQRKVLGILQDALVVLVVEERVRVLLPGYCLHAQHELLIPLPVRSLLTHQIK